MRVQNKEWDEERDNERWAVQTMGQQILECSTVPFCQALPRLCVGLGRPAGGLLRVRARERERAVDSDVDEVRRAPVCGEERNLLEVVKHVLELLRARRRP